MSTLRPLFRALCLAGPIVLSAGCSLALGGGDEMQCTTDADCEARGGDFVGSICVDDVCTEKPVVEDPKWGCVGHVDPPEGGKTDTLTARFLDLLSNEAAKDITVKLCNKFDTPCSAPLATPTPAPNGDVTVTLPSDIEAYLEVSGPDYFQTLAFLDHVAQTENPVVLMVPTSAAAFIAQDAGVTIDPTKGIILARTADCTNGPTAGASVSVFPSDMETRFYTINNSVTPNATQTDSAGNAGFVNVSPGSVTLTGTIGPGGKEYGKVQTLVRAGAITAQVLRPTPTL